MFTSDVTPLLHTILISLFFFFLMIPRPPISTLFPYTTLFRSIARLRSIRLPASLHESAFDRATGTSGQWVVQTTCAADRKSTRLNSSHTVISYAVFCLKKKKKKTKDKKNTKQNKKPNNYI